MNNAPDLNQIFEAAIFAAKKHQGQVRKDESRSPYVTHPISVAQTLFELGGITDTATLIAALLHDIIEDTSTTRDQVRTTFGDDILSLVLEVTDNKSLEKMERKRLQVLHAPHLSYRAKLIKLADKLTNCQDILFSPPRDWPLERRQEYIQWGADVVSQMRGTNPELEAAFDQVLADAQEQLGFVIQPFTTINQRSWAP